MARAALGFIALAPALAAHSAELTATPADYRARVAALAPGDVLTLGPGAYDGLGIRALAGEPGRPIVIQGPAAGPPAVLVGRACCPTIDLGDVAHLTLRRLELDQRSELVDAIRVGADFAHHVTLEDLRIHGFAEALSTTALEIRCPAWDWTVRRVRIERPGEGLLLGGAEGRSPFVRGILEQLLVIDPIGAALVVEGHLMRPTTPGFPAEDTITVVRHSVFTKAARAGVGVDARPTIRVGAPPAAGVGQGDRVELYGNLLFENASLGEVLVRAEGSVAIHDNLLVNSFGAALLLEARDGSVYHNTIYATGRAVEVSAGQRVVGNAVFSSSPSPIRGGAAADNAMDTLGRAAEYLVGPGLPLGQLDLFPLANGRLRGSVIGLEPFAAHVDYALDFNGTAKTGRARGAYEGEGANPGWRPAAELKTFPARPDAGVEPDAAGADAAAEPASDRGPALDGSGADRGAGDDDDGGARDAAMSARPAAREGCSCDAAADPHGTRSPVIAVMLAVALWGGAHRGGRAARPARLPHGSSARSARAAHGPS